ncbi:MAG TPA: VOC family protein [Planctomycetota bacterium]|nr:VOC family protein [Planctomycetota bacterium]
MSDRAANQVVWFDIPVTDLDRAIRFYTAVLGSPVTRHDFPGGALGVLAHGGDSVGGCLVMGGKPGGDGPLIYLNASGRLDQAVAAVTEHGGTVLEPRRSIAPHGWRALVRDSEGNRVALHSPD